jgi:hypothetical protein
MAAGKNVKNSTELQKDADKKQYKELKSSIKQTKKEIKSKKKQIKELKSKGKEDNPMLVFLLVFLIVFFWLGILAMMIKTDVGGYGANVLAPLIKDVPIIHNILPEDTQTDNATL